jgi:hypothetical protein
MTKFQLINSILIIIIFIYILKKLKVILILKVNEKNKIFYVNKFSYFSCFNYFKNITQSFIYISFKIFHFYFKLFLRLIQLIEKKKKYKRKMTC